MKLDTKKTLYIWYSGGLDSLNLLYWGLMEGFSNIRLCYYDDRLFGTSEMKDQEKKVIEIMKHFIEEEINGPSIDVRFTYIPLKSKCRLGTEIATLSPQAVDLILRTATFTVDGYVAIGTVRGDNNASDVPYYLELYSVLNNLNKTDRELELIFPLVNFHKDEIYSYIKNTHWWRSYRKALDRNLFVSCTDSFLINDFYVNCGKCLSCMVNHFIYQEIKTLDFNDAAELKFYIENYTAGEIEPNPTEMRMTSKEAVEEIIKTECPISHFEFYGTALLMYVGPTKIILNKSEFFVNTLKKNLEIHKKLP